MTILPFATGSAGVATVAAVDTEDVRLHVGVAGEELQTHAARELVLRELARLVLGVVVVVLELVSLTIFPQFEMRPGHFIFMQCHT